jgi:hypothetical protein
MSLTLEDFMATFLCNEAVEGVGKYHSENCADEVHNVSPWRRVPGSPAGRYSRAVDFTTKVVGSPIGPDKTAATKTQTMDWGTNGFVITTITDLKDIPSADAFVVRDVVSVLRAGEEDIRIHCSYQVDFLKSSFWKSIIESKTKNETKTWVTTYYKWAEGLKGKGGGGGSTTADNGVAVEEQEGPEKPALAASNSLLLAISALQGLVILVLIYLHVKQVRDVSLFSFSFCRRKPKLNPY